MFKEKRFVILSILLFALGILVFLAFKETKILRRDPVVLMNRYYLLKQQNPEAAQNALKVILRQDNTYLPALKELSQNYLDGSNASAALPLLQQLHRLLPDDANYSLQLANLYYELGDWKQAKSLYTNLSQEQSSSIKIEALQALDKMASFLPYYKTYAVADLKLHVLNSTSSSQFIPVLIDYYYKIKNEEPKQARDFLAALNFLTQDNAAIHEEMGYAALHQGDNAEAISYFSRVYQENPAPRMALQLAYLYMKQADYDGASTFFLLAFASEEPQIKIAALKGYALAHPQVQAPNQIVTTDGNASEDMVLLDQYYALKKSDKNSAWFLIQKIISKYPNNITALKEGGFLAIEKGQRQKAITYFLSAYKLTLQPDLAMQLGYLYDQTSDKAQAYRYFILATRTTDKNLEFRAQNAMTNLAGLQTKALPSPWFGEVFFDPFTQSRFGLTVRPLVSRLGIERNDSLQTKTYLVFRQTDDNKTANLGQVPQIYEDNVRIMGGGIQITPFKSIPVIGFVEAGMAYDLIYRQRDRWRGDLRGGLMYYNEFGKKPAWYDTLKMSTDYYSTLYGDVTYFSRFDNNVIGTLKTHQGIRLLQYRSSMLNLYLGGRVMEDSRREFFNNFAEIGPGIGFIPSNRYRLQIRFEHIKGVYLPAGGSVNPYGKYYTNNTVQLLIYAKI